MTNQNEKPPTNHHIDKKRKKVDTSSNGNGKPIRINPKHDDMLDLTLWSPNHNATPSSSSSPSLSLSEFPYHSATPSSSLSPSLSEFSTTTPLAPSQWWLSLSQPSSSFQITTRDGSAHPPPPPPSPPMQPNPNPNPSPPSSPEGAGDGEDSSSEGETIRPPYEWTTDRRAIVHTLEHLLSNQIEKIKGEVKCKRCECQYEMEFDLRDKFSQLEEFIWENKDEMYERAPEIWKNPTLPRCHYCHQDNSAKPVIGKSKKAINWLFLLLGQLVGCCTLEQLKYFCGQTKNHRTGAKDRLLYLVYLTLCRQLRPNNPNFHR